MCLFKRKTLLIFEGLEIDSLMKFRWVECLCAFMLHYTHFCDRCCSEYGAKRIYIYTPASRNVKGFYFFYYFFPLQIRMWIHPMRFAHL